MATTKTGDYEVKGDYHVDLDPTWRYYPVYVTKMEKIDSVMKKRKSLKILDVGCGEGVLVKKYRGLGYDIVGLDYNYSSDLVKQGDITQMPFEDGTFDLVLCLDVIEHIDILSHEKAISEIRRVLKLGGESIFTIPNLAHFASRITFLFFGKLLRTADYERHPSDRPYGEYKRMLKKHFDIHEEQGLFPTFPLISLLTYFYPAKSVKAHRLYNALFGRFSNLCFLNLSILKAK